MIAGFAVAASAAVADWFAVARHRPGIEEVAKPMVMVGLLFQVALVGRGGVAVLLAAAIVASLVGDVLLLPRFDMFIGGLAAFLVGHLLYVLVFLQLDLSAVAFAVGGVAMLAVGATIGRRIVIAVEGALAVAVGLYVAVLGVMVAVATATTTPAIAVGAAIFAASDAVLGWNRFVRPLAHGRLATHVPYHLGQAFIVFGVAGT